MAEPDWASVATSTAQSRMRVVLDAARTDADFKRYIVATHGKGHKLIMDNDELVAMLHHVWLAGKKSGEHSARQSQGGHWHD